MTRRRRTVLRAGATLPLLGLAGCASLDEEAQVLVLENETDTTHQVDVVVNTPPTDDAPEDTTTAGDDAPEDTTTAGDDATTTRSDRFVVDFTFDVDANDSKQLTELFPTDGTYEVVASVADVGRDATQYSDKENTRVRITDGGVFVTTFTGPVEDDAPF